MTQIVLDVINKCAIRTLLNQTLIGMYVLFLRDHVNFLFMENKPDIYDLYYTFSLNLSMIYIYI